MRAAVGHLDGERQALGRPGPHREAVPLDRFVGQHQQEVVRASVAADQLHVGGQLDHTQGQVAHPLELVRQTLSEHQYPDGFVLFLGTLFAPVQDRDEPGRGFTHKVGDRVAIASPKLGRLVNRVVTSKEAPPWTEGIGALMANLARRGLLG